MMAKTYGQFCGLARALDHVGDRWTLLIVRELLIEPAAYGTLLDALDGVATNLLADRLRRLEHDGLVTREPDPTDGRKHVYALTERGRDLELALLALITWGTDWMRPGPSDDVFQPKWIVLALRALMSKRRVAIDATVDVAVGDRTIRITSHAGNHLAFGPAADAAADALVQAPPELILGVVAGELTMAHAAQRGLTVAGDRRRARAVLEP